MACKHDCDKGGELPVERGSRKSEGDGSTVHVGDCDRHADQGHHSRILFPKFLDQSFEERPSPNDEKNGCEDKYDNMGTWESPGDSEQVLH